MREQSGSSTLKIQQIAASQVEGAPDGASVVSPRAFAELMGWK